MSGFEANNEAVSYLFHIPSGSFIQNDQGKSQARKATFKKGVEYDEARHRRVESTVQLRKEKKDMQIQKRRAVSLTLSFFL